MLRDIKQLCSERKRISLYDLSIHFDVELSAMEKMIDKLIAKGSVKKQEFKVCGGCAGGCCDPSKNVMYEWSE